MELVSVILPTFNRASTLGRAIRSVLEQSHSALELIVVDDASTDDTAQVVSAFPDCRLTYVRLPERSGAAKARNEGAALAKGRYLAFQDSDDVWHPEKLRRQMKRLTTAGGHFAACVCSCRLHKQGRIDTLPRTEVELSGEEVIARLLAGDSYSTATLVVPRHWFDTVGGFDVRLSRRQDFDLCLSLAACGPFVFEPEILVECYFGEDSISADPLKFMEATELIGRKHARVFARHRRGHAMQLYKAAKHLAVAGYRRKALPYSARALLLDPLNWRAASLLLLVVTGTLSLARSLRT